MTFNFYQILDIPHRIHTMSTQSLYDRHHHHHRHHCRHRHHHHHHRHHHHHHHHLHMISIINILFSKLNWTDLTLNNATSKINITALIIWTQLVQVYLYSTFHMTGVNLMCVKYKLIVVCLSILVHSIFSNNFCSVIFWNTYVSSSYSFHLALIL